MDITLAGFAIQSEFAAIRAFTIETADGVAACSLTSSV